MPGSDAVTVSGSQADWFELPTTGLFGTDRVDAAAYSFRNLCARAAELQKQVVDPEQYWERIGNAEMQMASLQDYRASSAVWQREYLGEWVSGSGAAPLPSEDNDVFESRLRSYVCSPFTSVYNGVFSISEGYEDTRPVAIPQVSAAVPPSRQDFGCGCLDCREQWDTKYGHLPAAWIKFWSNLGVAHTAAVFMLEVHWDDKEHRFNNEKVIRSYIGAEVGSD